MRSATVMFATGRTRGGAWRYRQATRLIRVVTRSAICHCMIGYRGIVLSPEFRGVRYYRQDKVLRYYPTLCGAFDVPLTHSLNLGYFAALTDQPQPMLPRLWRFATRGRGPWIYDCLGVVLMCLQAGAVPVPGTLYTPQQLHDWLEGRYDHVPCVRGRASALEPGGVPLVRP